MKKLILLSLVLVLSACTSATEVPVAAPTDVPPTSTPVVVVQTVVVEATQAPTEVPPTAVPPTEVPPTAVVVVQTVVVEPTQAAATQPPAVAAPNEAASGLVTVDAVLGAGYFTEMTRSASQLSLRCQLVKEVTFKVKPLLDTITQVEFYYRIVDRTTGTPFEWRNQGKMIPEADGTFSLVFNGEQVNADSRRPNAWLDYQFVGLSKTGGVVGRSEKIEKQITYTFDCP